MPSSSRTSAFARRAKRCAAEPSRANSVSSLRDAGVKKPRRIVPTVESHSRRLARGIFGFSQSRGILFFVYFSIFHEGPTFSGRPVPVFSAKFLLAGSSEPQNRQSS